MKPRIVKKLCKKVQAIMANDPRFERAWQDEEPIGYMAYGHLWAKDYANASAKKKRSHYHGRSNIRHCWMLGGEPDYWGEATDPCFLIDIARDMVLWEFGSNGDDENWPEPHKRLTGREVLKKVAQLAQA